MKTVLVILALSICAHAAFTRCQAEYYCTGGLPVPYSLSVAANRYARIDIQILTSSAYFVRAEAYTTPSESNRASNIHDGSFNQLKGMTAVATGSCSLDTVGAATVVSGITCTTLAVKATVVA